ncbi:hypothetical protein J6590_061752 [Homalodisca vitripennis]|nr:hypothetical protein J6590_061752 [Homalodisca vitripennis]
MSEQDDSDLSSESSADCHSGVIVSCGTKQGLVPGAADNNCHSYEVTKSGNGVTWTTLYNLFGCFDFILKLYDIGFTFKSREEAVKVTDFRSLFPYSAGTVLTQRD